MTKVLNLVAGPGVGKSTTASLIFGRLKCAKVSCELIPEFPKELTWEESHKVLENQVYIFAEQYRRQFRLINKVDWIITDSPLVMSAVYFELNRHQSKVPLSEEYADLTRRFFNDTYKQFKNVNILLPREKEYDPNGRNQTEEEAKHLDTLIQNNLYLHASNVYIPAGKSNWDIALEVAELVREGYFDDVE